MTAAPGSAPLPSRLPFGIGALATLSLSAPIRAAVDAFDTLPLEELQAANLQNRVDTKFMFTEAQLAEVLAHVAPRYRMVAAFGFTLSHYTTLYFDTPHLAMYLQHHNSVRERFKVRIRSYVGTQVSFLEVKRKSNKERTVKTRMRVPYGEPLGGAAADFVPAHSPYTLDVLQPTLINHFWRMTLVAREEVERITIDVGLHLGVGGRSEHLERLVIAEVKQPKFTSRSAFVQEMRRLHMEPAGFSKYAMGIAMLEPGVKVNMFKPRLRVMQRLLADARAPGVLLPVGV